MQERGFDQKGYVDRKPAADRHNGHPDSGTFCILRQSAVQINDDESEDTKKDRRKSGDIPDHRHRIRDDHGKNDHAGEHEKHDLIELILAGQFNSLVFSKMADYFGKSTGPRVHADDDRSEKDDRHEKQEKIRSVGDRAEDIQDLGDQRVKRDLRSVRHEGYGISCISEEHETDRDDRHQKESGKDVDIHAADVFFEKRFVLECALLFVFRVDLGFL